MTARRRPADQFELLCRQAAGRAIPEPPEIPGRSFVQRVNTKDHADPFAEAWDQRQPAAAPVAESTTANGRAAQGLRSDQARDPPASPPHITQPGAPAPGLAPGAPAMPPGPQARPASSPLVTT